MRLRRAGYAVGLLVAFALGVLASPLALSAEPLRPDLGTFWKAWDLAHDNFVYRDALVSEKLVHGAIRGMIEALGDDGHTRYLTPEDVRLERGARSGRFDGIGAEVSMRGGRPVIVAPIEDSPAERAGMRPGDTILAIDGVDVDSLTLSELIDRVRGPRGVAITLLVQHPNESSPVELTITRDQIRVKSVNWAIVPGTLVAHIRINRFAGDTTEELKSAVLGARQSGATGLVLDLRNNPGGVLNQSVSAASQFLTKGDVLLEEDAGGKRKGFPVELGGVALDLPIAVLINRGSASASEIFAGAMQDHQRGPVIGEKTFGTGTVLTPYDLPGGAQIWLGVRQWLTPNGRVIRKVGIKPDVSVTMPADSQPLSPREAKSMSYREFVARADAPLMKALEVLGAPRQVDLLPAA